MSTKNNAKSTGNCSNCKSTPSTNRSSALESADNVLLAAALSALESGNRTVRYVCISCVMVVGLVVGGFAYFAHNLLNAEITTTKTVTTTTTTEMKADDGSNITGNTVNNGGR